MKPDINSYRSWLDEKRINLVQVYDDCAKPINNAKFSAADIQEKFGGHFMAMLEFIKTKYPHLSKIYLQKLQRHGTAYKNREDLVPFNLIDKRATGEPSLPNPTTAKPINRVEVSQVIPPQPPQVTYPNHNGHGIGLMGAMGLSMPDIMEMHTAKSQMPELKSRVDRLEEDKRKLEEEVKRLERENLKYELGVEGRPSSIEKLIDSISDPDTLETLISAIKNKQETAPGLGEPQTNSKTKDALIKVITKESVTDEIATYGYNVIKLLCKGDKALAKLIHNHINNNTDA